MNKINIWRFVSNGYGPENGLDTGDVETFKKDPDGALAREISQNTIDARQGELPVRVEFKIFEVERNNIPGINDLTDEIERCCIYKEDSEKESKQLKKMKKWINKKTIKCLRISDFNTTGLKGVSTNQKGLPFYNLTKGSGVSDKVGSSGGSKGIGKFASFVTSATNTVFYSTKTEDSEEGFIGISKLRSVPVKNDNTGLLTQGIGYFGRNKMNEPILEQLNLDPSYKRTEYGTDVYLIGFNDRKGWQNDIIAKILDSFMVAIMHHGFEVIVDNVVLNSDTLGSILSDENRFTSRYKREVKDIKAQYELLNGGERVFSEDLIIGDENKVTVYVKQYLSEEEKNANKRCLMVRYPYMKIMHKTGMSYLPYSAMCVIHDNKLNKMLRNIENPQHTEWELKRLNDYPVEKKETRELMKDLFTSIEEYIKKIMKQNDSDTTDVEGAGKFLPSDTEGILIGEQVEVDKMDVTPLKRATIVNPKTAKSGKHGNVNEVGDGSIDGEDDGAIPGGDEPGGIINPNPEPNPEPNPNPFEGDVDEGKTGEDGQTPILKKVSLSGMKYKNIVVDRDRGRYNIVFTSLFDENNCDLALKMYGDGKDRYDIKILSASHNGKSYPIENGRITGIELSKNCKYIISCELETKELFASEVIVNAYR